MAQSQRIANVTRLGGKRAKPTSHTPPGAAAELDSYRTRLVAVRAVHAVAGIRPARRSLFAKRLLDLLICVPALLLSLPLCLIIALAIYLESRGPVLFRQVRLREGGHPFTCFKFRTMRHAPEQEHDPIYMTIAAKWMLGIPLDETVAESAQSLCENHAGYWPNHAADMTMNQVGMHEKSHTTQRVYKLRNDSRVTRVGRILRRTSIDELPQLLNVLRGEMSIVGPRPPIPYEVERYSDRALARLYVKPGLTGVWQVTGRGRVSFDEMIEMDLDYVLNSSLLRDIVIIARTIPSVMVGRGAA